MTEPCECLGYGLVSKEAGHCPNCGGTPPDLGIPENAKAAMLAESLRMPSGIDLDNPGDHMAVSRIAEERDAWEKDGGHG